MSRAKALLQEARECLVEKRREMAQAVPSSDDWLLASMGVRECEDAIRWYRKVVGDSGATE